MSAEEALTTPENHHIADFMKVDQKNRAMAKSLRALRDLLIEYHATSFAVPSGYGHNLQQRGNRPLNEGYVSPEELLVLQDYARSFLTSIEEAIEARGEIMTLRG